jgi:hypothetical protein
VLLMPTVHVMTGKKGAIAVGATRGERATSLPSLPHSIYPCYQEHTFQVTYPFFPFIPPFLPPFLKVYHQGGASGEREGREGGTAILGTRLEWRRRRSKMFFVGLEDGRRRGGRVYRKLERNKSANYV